MRVFPEEIIIGISILSKADCFSMWVGIIQSVEGLTRTVRQKKNKFVLLFCTGISVFSCPWTSVFMFLRSLNSDWDLSYQPPDSQDF